LVPNPLQRATTAEIFLLPIIKNLPEYQKEESALKILIKKFNKVTN
jgi:hypothetical protein